MILKRNLIVGNALSWLTCLIFSLPVVGPGIVGWGFKVDGSSWLRGLGLTVYSFVLRPEKWALVDSPFNNTIMMHLDQIFLPWRYWLCRTHEVFKVLFGLKGHLIAFVRSSYTLKWSNKWTNMLTGKQNKAVPWNTLKDGQQNCLCGKSTL